MQTLTDYLQKNSAKLHHSGVIQTLVKAMSEIAKTLRNPPSKTKAKKTAPTSRNASGDTQVPLDILSNQLLVNALKKNPHVALIASEELEKPIVTASARASATKTFSVTFDPLDGSSVIDANFTVGTIVGIWRSEAKPRPPAPQKNTPIINTTGRAQVASLLAIYGPKFCLFLATQNGVSQFQWSEEKKSFLLQKEGLKLKTSAPYFAPGNLTAQNSAYQKLFGHWLKNGYKLRYSGSMAADLSHIFTKGGGIYAYPASPEHPSGKLRLLYECAPLAFMVEKAGGLAQNAQGKNILDIPITAYHQTSEIFIGSQREVKDAVKLFRAH